MLYDLQGTIKALGERIEGTSRNGQPWQKCEVAVEVQDGQYSDTVALTAFGDRVDDVIGRLKEGDEVSVKFTISAREYNGRYYNDINIVSIRRARQEGWSERLAKNGAQPATRKPAPAPKSRVDEILDGTFSGADQDDDLPE